MVQMRPEGGLSDEFARAKQKIENDSKDLLKKIESQRSRPYLASTALSKEVVPSQLQARTFNNLPETTHYNTTTSASKPQSTLGFFQAKASSKRALSKEKDQRKSHSPNKYSYKKQKETYGRITDEYRYQKPCDEQLNAFDKEFDRIFSGN
jgi:hypothetical protein